MATPETVTLGDGRQVRLGRIRPKVRPSVLKFACYFDSKKAAPTPSAVDFSSKAMEAIRRMYLNDQYGDCVIAGKYHQLGLWSGNDKDSGGIVLGSDQEVLSAYHKICGPGDNGCSITEVLDVFRSEGLTAKGKKYTIDGYVSIDNANILQVKVAILLFGSLTLGINLPGAWTQGGDGSVWGVTNTGIVGGHDVCCVGYNPQGVQIATWGGLRTITWAAFTSSKWIDECYAQLAGLWYGPDKISPYGFDAATLKADLEKLGGGIIPDIDPPGPPPPPPPPPGPPGPVVEVKAIFEGPLVAGEYVLTPAMAPGGDPRSAISLGVILQVLAIVLTTIKKPNLTAADLIGMVSQIALLLGLPIPVLGPAEPSTGIVMAEKVQAGVVELTGPAT